MIHVSEIYTDLPKEFKNEVQKRTYNTLKELSIDYERVDTDEAITMEDCIAIGEKLNTKVVKTLFLCNRQKTDFYLFVLEGDKKFDTKKFCSALNISRTSFASEELLNQMLGTKIGATTIFSSLVDEKQKVKIVVDRDVLKEEYYGCSDGTTTGYMKLKTADVIKKVLPYSKHKERIIEF